MAFDPRWITAGITSEAIKYCEDFATKLVEKNYTPTQLRSIYSELKRIEFFVGEIVKILKLHEKKI